MVLEKFALRRQIGPDLLMMMPFPIQHQRKALPLRSSSDFQATKSKRAPLIDRLGTRVPDLMIVQPDNTVDPFALVPPEHGS